MLTVLGGLAEFERELIRARTSEGRTRAKGRRAGRNRFIAPFSKASFQVVRTAFLDELSGLILLGRNKAIAPYVCCP
jgi:DNA invertase Pin-like site-specific DNA recombinase